MAIKHSIYDTDPHFKIDPITRLMSTESQKVTLQQFDHNAERFTFEVPRFYEGHDLSLCDPVQVHYINIDAKTKKENTDVYDIDDIQISPDGEDVVICSWLIKNTATQYAGTLAFLLKFRCLVDGKVSYEWNTAPFKNITISEGFNNGDVVVEEYADILTQWEQRLMSAGGEGVNVVEVAEAEALQSIATAKQAALAEIENRDRSLIANALKGFKSGTAISLPDISPFEHILGVKVRSKNLIPYVDVSTVNVKACGKNLIPYPYYDKYTTRVGITLTHNEDGTITANGTPAANVYFILAQDYILPVGKYFLSGNTSDHSTTGIVLYLTNSDLTFYKGDAGNGISLDNTEERKVLIAFSIPKGTTVNNLVFKPQLEIGTTATEYEPYKSNTYSVNADGTVEGVTSIYPTTTLIPDKEGVVLDVEYNRDINKAFATLEAALINNI